MKVRLTPYPPFPSQKQERCIVVSSEEMTCVTPRIPGNFKVRGLWFQLDNVYVDFESIKGRAFTYYPNPEIYILNTESPDTPYRFKPGGVIAVEVGGQPGGSLIPLRP